MSSALRNSVSSFPVKEKAVDCVVSPCSFNTHSCNPCFKDPLPPPKEFLSQKQNYDVKKAPKAQTRNKSRLEIGNFQNDCMRVVSIHVVCSSRFFSLFTATPNCMVFAVLLQFCSLGELLWSSWPGYSRFSRGIFQISTAPLFFLGWRPPHRVKRASFRNLEFGVDITHIIMFVSKNWYSLGVEIISPWKASIIWTCCSKYTDDRALISLL